MSDFVPSTSACRLLSARFGLPYHDGMQDWEYEVADATRFQEFLEAYRHTDLSEAERGSLMEVLVQCVEDLFAANPDRPPGNLPEWRSLAGLLREHYRLRAASVDYWSCLEEPDLAMCFYVTAPMRTLRADLWQQTSGGSSPQHLTPLLGERSYRRA